MYILHNKVVQGRRCKSRIWNKDEVQKFIIILFILVERCLHASRPHLQPRFTQIGVGYVVLIISTQSTVLTKDKPLIRIFGELAVMKLPSGDIWLQSCFFESYDRCRIANMLSIP